MDGWMDGVWQFSKKLKFLWNKTWEKISRLKRCHLLNELWHDWRTKSDDYLIAFSLIGSSSSAAVEEAAAAAAAAAADVSFLPNLLHLWTCCFGLWFWTKSGKILCYVYTHLSHPLETQGILQPFLNNPYSMEVVFVIFKITAATSIWNSSLHKESR